MILDPSIFPVAVVDQIITRGDPLSFDFATLLSYWIHADDPWAMHDMAQMPADEACLYPRAKAVATREADRPRRPTFCSIACWRWASWRSSSRNLGCAGAAALLPIRYATPSADRTGILNSPTTSRKGVSRMLAPRRRSRARLLEHANMDFAELQGLQRRIPPLFIRDKIVSAGGLTTTAVHRGIPSRTRSPWAEAGLLAPHACPTTGLGLDHNGKAIVFEEAAIPCQVRGAPHWVLDEAIHSTCCQSWNRRQNGGCSWQETWSKPHDRAGAARDRTHQEQHNGGEGCAHHW